MSEMYFMGHDMEYWAELERDAIKNDKTDYIQEIANLRARVSFYESRINQLHKFMVRKIEVKK